MNTPIILIPAYHPTDQLTALIEQLNEAMSGSSIIVIDDGNEDKAHKDIFGKIAQKSNVKVLHHAINLGKGAALKTGLNYIYVHFPDAPGVITADADGQHRPKDIKKVAQDFQNSPQSLILGSRSFDKGTPLRSLFGNKLTSLVCKLALGIKLEDTQTGLRAIPRSIIPDLLRIKSNRYEFEMDMLGHVARAKHDLREVPIETVYIDNNSGSHFNPLLDSLRIYFTLLRFALSSFLTFLIDFTVFTIVFKMNGLVGLANILARLAALFFYFVLTKNFVFHAKDCRHGVIFRYLLVVIVSGIISYLSQTAISDTMGTSAYISKIGVETVMFFINFLLLRDFVYTKKIPD